MCFNATTSLLTFCLTVVTSSYLCYTGYKNNDKSDKIFSLVIILIGLMQLTEYFLWKNQHCNYTNHIFSLLIIVVLFLQPVLTIMYSYYLYPSKQNCDLYYTFYIVFFSLVTSYILYWLNKTNLCSKPNSKSCRLVWAPITKLYNENIFLFLLWFTLYFIGGTLAFFKTVENANDILKYKIRYAFLPFTFMLAGLYTIITLGFKSFNPFFYLSYADVFGSMWCFMAVFLGIIGVLHI
jgi:hypothetical protein